MIKQSTKKSLTLENGVQVYAQFPKIVSASRSTDIPAFYADWFFDRLKKGYSAWINPYNNQKLYVSYEDTKFIVFWSKNPRPLLPYLDYLKERNINYYIQYTLNDYDKERLEPNVPSLQYRIDTFKRLVDYFGDTKHVIWRFDPLILTDTIAENDLLRKVERVGDELKGYTEKLIFSFADIAIYRKVKKNLITNNIHYREWETAEQMNLFATQLAELNKKWKYRIATCGEKIDLEKLGIEHNRCIDDEQIIRIAYKDKDLCNYLSYYVGQNDDIFGNILTGAICLQNGLYAFKTKTNPRNSKDKGQRELCGCIVAKDIGQYNTCPHLCEYCYANTNKESALENYRRHKQNLMTDIIIGG
jgi:DNA repair photolyase